MEKKHRKLHANFGQVDESVEIGLVLVMPMKSS